MNSRLSSEEVKRVELDILKEFDRLCTRNGLTYCLAYGTCLGALRHKGFIPWDDDIDVYMPRPDYDRFFELATSIPETQYQVRCCLDKSSYHYMIKYVDVTTVCHESYVDEDYSIGLWIDVFPIDRVDVSSMRNRAILKGATFEHALKSVLLQLSMGDSSAATSALARAIKKMLSPMKKVLDPIRISQSMDKLARSITARTRAAQSDCFGQGSYVCFADYVVPGLHPKVYPGDMLFPASLAPFETEEFPIPRKAEQYLSMSYGDWTKLPPESERHAHFTEAYRC